MKRRRHTPDQVIRKLREADAMLAQGADVASICRYLEVSEQTYHRWRNQFGGMKADDAKRLKELEGTAPGDNQTGGSPGRRHLDRRFRLLSRQARAQR